MKLARTTLALLLAITLNGQVWAQALQGYNNGSDIPVPSTFRSNLSVQASTSAVVAGGATANITTATTNVQGGSGATALTLTSMVAGQAYTICDQNNNASANNITVNYDGTHLFANPPSGSGVTAVVMANNGQCQQFTLDSTTGLVSVRASQNGFALAPPRGAPINVLGDSFAGNNNFMSPPAFQYVTATAAWAQGTSRSYMSWMAAFSRGALDFTLNRGYQGPNSGVSLLYIRIQPQGCTSNPSVSLGAATATLHYAATGGTITSGGHTYNYVAGNLIPDGLSAGGLPYVSMTNYGAGTYTTSVSPSTTGGGCSVAGTLDALVASNGTFAVPGQNSTQILWRTPDAIASGVQYLVIGMGGNDAISGITPATTEANIASAVTQTLQAGITPILVPINPKQINGDTAANVLRDTLWQGQVDAWIRQYAFRTPGVIYASMNGTIANPGNSLSGMQPNYTYDGAHLTTLGAFWTGYAMWNSIKYAIPPYVGTNPI